MLVRSEVHQYDSSAVIWSRAPSKPVKTPPATPREAEPVEVAAAAPEGDASAAAMSSPRVERPALKKAVGYTVEVPSTLPDAQEGDHCVGVVVSVDKKKNTITVCFDDPIGETPVDVEVHQYDSSAVIWSRAP